MQTSLATHIDSRPDRCGGKPCIAGTRIRVQDVYVWHELEGMSPDEIVAEFPHLSLGQVHAALAYYYDHRDEIQAACEAENAFGERMKASQTSKLLTKLAGKDAQSSSVAS